MKKKLPGIFCGLGMTLLFFGCSTHDTEAGFLAVALGGGTALRVGMVAGHGFSSDFVDGKLTDPLRDGRGKGFGKSSVPTNACLVRLDVNSDCVLDIKAWVKNGDMAILVDTRREKIPGQAQCVVYLHKNMEIKTINIQYRISKF